MPRRPRNPAVTFWRHPCLPGLELRASSFGARAFREHFHTVYSIGLIDEGSTASTVSGRSYRATRGQLVVLEPYAVHACHPVVGSVFSYRMFFVEHDWLASPGEAELSFPTPALDDPGLFATLSGLYNALLTASDLAGLEQRLRQAFSALALTHGRARGAEQRTPVDELGLGGSAVAGALDRRDVASLARTAGMSRAHFSRRFKSTTGLSPHAYLILLRVEAAKRLLANGASIAATASEVGFSDQSHFARTFRRFSGATPAQYQAASLRD